MTLIMEQGLNSALRVKHRAEALRFELKAKKLRKEQFDNAFNKLSDIIKRKHWNRQTEMIRKTICPVCENLIKFDRKPAVMGVHNKCFVKLAEENYALEKD